MAPAPVQVVQIVAIARRRVIGFEGRLPWKLPDDLRRFKAATMGHPMVMGRKTFASLGRPLPGRANVVVTRQPGFRPPQGVLVAGSPDEALEAAARLDPRVFVIGGASLYEASLPRATEIDATLIHHEFPGDTFFPLLDAAWHVAAREDHVAQAVAQQPELRYSFVRFERRAGADACALCHVRARRPLGDSASDAGLALVLADLVGQPKR